MSKYIAMFLIFGIIIFSGCLNKNQPVTLEDFDINLRFSDTKNPYIDMNGNSIVIRITSGKNQ
jgi:hypothetical protein